MTNNIAKIRAALEIADRKTDEFDAAWAALAELEKAAAEPVATVLGIVVEWTGEQPPEAGTKLYAAPPAKPAPDIYDAYKSWPEDIRKKLSLHDLRRMSGWRMQAEFNPLNHEQSR